MEINIGDQKFFYFDLSGAKDDHKFYEYKEYELSLSIIDGYSPEEAHRIALERYPEFKSGEWQGSTQSYDPTKWRVK